MSNWLSDNLRTTSKEKDCLFVCLFVLFACIIAGNKLYFSFFFVSLLLFIFYQKSVGRYRLYYMATCTSGQQRVPLSTLFEVKVATPPPPAPSSSSSSSSSNPLLTTSESIVLRADCDAYVSGKPMQVRTR